MQFTTKKDINRYLQSIPRFQTSGTDAVDFDLNRFRDFCKRMGNPEDRFPSIHVAGTNGKGSTSQILASIYQHAGYSTGLYTSPHLTDYSERFRINGTPISDRELIRFFQLHEQDISRCELTYFELSTAIAFWWFSYRGVDLGIIEVGLGGRLDATNVLTPEVSVITSVSLDHSNVLGETIQEIAEEKAGIIKEHTPVVVGNLDRPAREVIESVAASNNTRVIEAVELNPCYAAGRIGITVEGREFEIEAAGFAPVQKYNIATAWQVARVLHNRFPVGASCIERGISGARTLCSSWGRFEKLDPGLEWYFDGAHNIESVKALKQAVASIEHVGNTIVVLAVMADKMTPELAAEFLEFKNIFYHPLNNQRAAPFSELKNVLPPAERFPARELTRNRLLKEFKSELVIFAGSFYFYSTVRDWLASFTIAR